MKTLLFAVLAVVSAGAWPLGVRAQEGAQPGVGATTRPMVHAGAGEVLYEDPTGQSSATVTQLLGQGNNSLQNTTYTGIRRIVYRNDIVIIEHGEAATTLLPKQFVASISLNRRAPVAPR